LRNGKKPSGFVLQVCEAEKNHQVLFHEFAGRKKTARFVIAGLRNGKKLSGFVLQACETEKTVRFVFASCISEGFTQSETLTNKDLS
jgi:hypothetical protein